MKNTLFITLAAILSLTGGIVVQQLSKQDSLNNVTTGLSFSFPDLNGKQHSIADWQGKIRVLNFWATWCPPCLKEIPEFINMQNQYGNKKLQFIGIAVEEKEAVEDYLKSIKINYPILIGGDNAIMLTQQLGNIVNAVPFSLIINQQGQIIYRQAGEISRKKIIEIITPLL